MSLLLKLLVYAVVGSSEWYLALRRTLACARGERAVMVSIVFLENILGLWVLANFVRESDWLVAVSYSAGGALGAFFVNFKEPAEKRASAAATSQAPGDGAAPARRAVVGFARRRLGRPQHGPQPPDACMSLSEKVNSPRAEVA